LIRICLSPSLIFTPVARMLVWLTTSRSLFSLSDLIPSFSYSLSARTCRAVQFLLFYPNGPVILFQPGTRIKGASDAMPYLYSRERNLSPPFFQRLLFSMCTLRASMTMRGPESPRFPAFSKFVGHLITPRVKPHSAHEQSHAFCLIPVYGSDGLIRYLPLFGKALLGF